MSSLAKLSIRGVRAFAPDDDEQIVEFFFPFTIIVGQNGCGKTTIVECIKYAITGGLPPGNKSGQAFVHDPRQSGTKQTKAAVKLRFTSRNGQPTVILRSMELTQNKTTLTFKQLDGVIRTQDESGKRVALSHKCSELDSQVPVLLGTSKAILDSVLFCHQEESNWPLQEGAVLKKKFDDIFDSTRYTKALEAFRKKEKELTSKCKDIKVDLAGLQSTMTAVEGYRRDLREQQDEEERISGEKDEITKQIEEADKEIEYYTGIVLEISKAQSQLQQIQSRANEHKAALDRQQKMVEEDMSTKHTMQDLRSMLDGFDAKVRSQKAGQETLEIEIEDINREIDTLHKSEMDAKLKLGKLESERDAYEYNLKERIRVMETIATAYNVDLQELTQTQNTNASFHGSLHAASQSVDTQQLAEISAEDMQSFFRKIETIRGQLTDELSKHKQRVQQEEDQLQKVLIDLGGKLSALEKDKDEISNQKREYRDELNLLNKEISANSRMRRSEVEEARKNAERLAKERDEANNSPRIQNIEVEIRQIEDKWETIKRKQTELKMELDSLQESADAHTAIATLEEELAREFEMLEELVKDCSSLLCRFNLQDYAKLPSLDKDGQAVINTVERLETEISGKLNETQAQLDAATGAYKKQESLVSERNWALRGGRQSLQSLRQQIDRFAGEHCCLAVVQNVVNEIRKVDPSITIDEKSPHDILKYLDGQIAERVNSDEDLGDPEMIKAVIKALYELGLGKTACPCCEQALDNPQKKAAFMQKFRDLRSDTSPLLNRAATAAKGVLIKLQEWRKTVSDNLMDLLTFLRLEAEIELQEKEIQQWEDELSVKMPVLAKHKDDMEDLKAELADIQELAKAADRWKDVSLRIGQKAITIQGKRSDLSILAHPVAAGRDRRTVDREHSQIMEEMERLSNKKTELNAEATKLNQQISLSAHLALNAESRAKEKATKFAEAERALNRKNEVLDLQKTLLDKEKLVDREIPSLRMRIQERESEKQRLRHTGSSEEQKLQHNVQEFEATVKRLGTLTYLITDYAKSGKAQEELTLHKTLSGVSKNIQLAKERLVQTQPLLDQCRTLVNDQERKKLQLQYNIQILEEKGKLNQLKEQIRNQKAAIEAIEHSDTAGSVRRDLLDRKTMLLEKKNRYEGRYSEIVGRIQSVHNKLKLPEYRDVDKKHRKAKVEYETTHMAADDLKKYQNALDNALLQFHAKKLTEINKIVRELWLMTYKGEDITNIEIQSGQEPGARAQKSYNYRVVMSKGVTELDMRGRCSAGQRVLACIVIRLALAESFGVSCGCIALDEPTVNLDYENKRGLAIALAQIISSRSRQLNFQLILITHDEEFVSMMKTDLASLSGFSMPEKYFKVVREEGTDGKLYSKIHEVDWDNV